VWTFDQLPTKGGVPSGRTPYSGYIYPDRQGGTSAALRKYDRAFHGGRNLATSEENRDIQSSKKYVPGRGLFRAGGGIQSPHWYGHCNGWTAATIRHAEPTNSVQRNGVVFTPSDVKALLAEVYMYNENEYLGGTDYHLDAGTFHAVLANWLGRGSHPLGMEADPGEEKWNYPIYSFASAWVKQSSRAVEVKTNIAYCKDSDREYDKSPHHRTIKYFHYTLNLNAKGEIVGGSFHRDSSVIEMLWVPPRLKKSRQPGNERGNPYIDVDKVLAIWRDSVPYEIRRKWLVIDPAEEDRVLDLATIESLVPIQDSAPLPPMQLILSRSSDRRLTSHTQ
jgi:hypothetical protein